MPDPLIRDVIPNLDRILNRHGLPPSDHARVTDLMTILPKDGGSVLDAGAHMGYCSELLTTYFDHVTAIDIDEPRWSIPGVVTARGDITNLSYPDGSFDCVFCAEVLEHIPALRQACAELTRVCRKHVVIGVPFDQDLRVGRTTCPSCGEANPCYGHVNSFTAEKLAGLFSGLKSVSVSYVWPLPPCRTTGFAAWLMNQGRNPYGSYDQYQVCVHCGRPVTAPKNRTFLEKACVAVAVRMDAVQNKFGSPKPGWLHMVFRKD
jgi:SAM-dependent methyltransferase